MGCCRYPFERLNIEWDGNVTFCCPAFTHDYLLGNIFKDSVEDLLYGEKAVEFRKSVYNNTYKYCDLKYCFEYRDYNIKEFEEKFVDRPLYPKVVHLSYVKACNVRCMTCRDDLIVETKENIENFNKIIDKVMDICRDAEIVYLNGSGEVFVSSHLKSLIKKISDKYPNIKFMIVSNGLLFNEKHVKEFGFDGKIWKVGLSIHGATKKTYERIVRGGHWEQLHKNLKYISKLKKKGEIRELDFNFVFHSLNFKEMPKFVKMANKYGANAYFSRFRKWGDSSVMCSNYEKYTCWEPNHPDYKEFIKVLRKLKGMKGYKLAEDYFIKLQSRLKETFIMKIKYFIIGLFKKKKS